MMRDALEARSEMQDATFDKVFPSAHRYRSYLHWTPVAVAVRACAMLAPAARVLDVGSGVGKVCLIGAATTTSAWVGVERDPEMVRVARRAAIKMRVEQRASFTVGDITGVDWSAFDGFYLFNPFAEILFCDGGDAAARHQSFARYIELVQHQLGSVPPATRVVTYHGFGGEMPPGFERVRRDADELSLWIRTRPRSPARTSGDDARK